VLPESLKPENRREFSWKRANPIGALLALKRFPAVLGLVECYFILMLAQAMMFTMWALYTGYRYHWTPSDVGFSLMYVGVLSGLVQAVLVKRIVPWLGDTKAVTIGLLISTVAYMSYGLAPHGWIVFGIMTFACFGGISGPALQSYVTKHVPANEQGAVQGVFGSLQSLASIPGPIIATWSFGWAIADDPAVRLPWIFAYLDETVTWGMTHVLPRHPGIPFFEAAAFVLLALWLARRSFAKDAKVAAAGS
jgi:DHA1 family tetracycline resistance protein-like MFS transporter